MNGHASFSQPRLEIVEQGHLQRLRCGLHARFKRHLACVQTRNHFDNVHVVFVGQDFAKVEFLRVESFGEDIQSLLLGQKKFEETTK